MRTLLIGADGQLGRELATLLEARGELVCSTLDGVDADLALDLSHPGALEDSINAVQPGIIINAAAYTAVDKAESEPELAQAINGDAPGVLAGWAAQNNASLVHFSTDYVFDGRKASPYLESDPVAPLNVYGATKLAGERAVNSAKGRSLILRTSWVYASHGQNFVLTMLRLARERDALKVVSDQIGRPTWAANLARYAVKALDKNLLEQPAAGPRVLHAADSGVYSWFEFARLIFETAHGLGLIDHIPALQEVGSDAFQTDAQRPSSSVLGTGALRRSLEMEPATVKESLTACLKEVQVRE